MPIEAAAPKASRPSVPGSGAELLPPDGGGGHIPGTTVQGDTAWAAGAPIAITAATNKLNVILLTAPPTYIQWL